MRLRSARTGCGVAACAVSPSPPGRGVGERVRSRRCIALRPNPHPPVGTLSRREWDSNGWLEGGRSTPALCAYALRERGVEWLHARLAPLPPGEGLGRGFGHADASRSARTLTRLSAPSPEGSGIRMGGLREAASTSALRAYALRERLLVVRRAAGVSPSPLGRGLGRGFGNADAPRSARTLTRLSAPSPGEGGIRAGGLRKGASTSARRAYAQRKRFFCQRDSQRG